MHRTERGLRTRGSRAQLAVGLAAVAALVALTLSDEGFWRDLFYQLVELIQEWDRLPQ